MSATMLSPVKHVSLNSKASTQTHKTSSRFSFSEVEEIKRIWVNMFCFEVFSYSWNTFTTWPRVTCLFMRNTCDGFPPRHLSLMSLCEGTIGWLEVERSCVVELTASYLIWRVTKAELGLFILNRTFTSSSIVFITSDQERFETNPKCASTI